MDIYRDFMKGVGLIGVANALISVSGIILLPILTKSLPAGDYGAYVQVTTTVALLAFPLTLGLSLALISLWLWLGLKQTYEKVFIQSFLL